MDQRLITFLLFFLGQHLITFHLSHILWQVSRTETSVLSHFSFLAQRANVVFRPFVDTKSQVRGHIATGLYTEIFMISRYIYDLYLYLSWTQSHRPYRGHHVTGLYADTSMISRYIYISTQIYRDISIYLRRYIDDLEIYLSLCLYLYSTQMYL